MSGRLCSEDFQMQRMIIICLISVVMLSSIGCRKRSGQRDKFRIHSIKKTGILKWEGLTNGGTVVPITCYVYPSTNKLDEEFATKVKARNEMIEHYRKAMAAAETYLVWRLAREGSDELETDMNWFLGSWPKWPIVIYWDSGGATMDGKYHKICVLCRYKKKQFDLGFVVADSVGLSSREVLYVVRWLTLQLGKLSHSEWSDLPKKDYPIVNADGAWAKELLPKEGSTDFLRQH